MKRYLILLQKPLALYFFQQAHQLYRQPVEKELSPSFWESEDRSLSQWRGFEAVLPGIEHELGEGTTSVKLCRYLRVQADCYTPPVTQKELYDILWASYRNL